MKKIILLTILMCSLSMSSEITESDIMRNCLDSENLNDIDMLECAITENELTSRAFEVTLKKIVNSIKDKKAKEKLLLSQEAWVKFRDRDSDFFAATAKNENMKFVIRLTNMTSMTLKREQDLLDSVDITE